MGRSPHIELHESMRRSKQATEEGPTIREGDPTTNRVTEVQPRSDRRNRTTTIEIEVEVEERWDALALSELLIPFHSFLVQHDHDRWVVHARAPGFREQTLSDALATINDWRFGRHLEAATCRVGGQPYDLSEATAACTIPRPAVG